MDDHDIQLRLDAEFKLKDILHRAGAPNPSGAVDSILALPDDQLREFLVAASRLLPRAAVHALGVAIIGNQPMPNAETIERILAITREIFGEATIAPEDWVLVEGWPQLAVRVRAKFEEAADKADQWHRRMIELDLPVHDRMAFVLDKTVADDED